MSKFKIGDKVVVNKVMVGSEHNGCCFTEWMKEYIGEEVVIVIVERELYYAKHSDGRFCGYAESWIRHAKDDHPVYKDGKIDVEKLSIVLNHYQRNAGLKLFEDASAYITGWSDSTIDLLNGGNLNHLNTLYKEITTSKKASLMDQIVKDSIEQEIKKMEDAIAELRKQLV